MRLFLLWVVIALLASGCSINSVTGENELLFTSVITDTELGERNYGLLKQAQGGDYHSDPGLQRYVSDVGQRLAAASDNRELPYEFSLVNSPVPNAWALLGGKIAITRGLLLHLRDEAQLAAGLAHEIIHATARHPESHKTRGTLIEFGVGLMQQGFNDQQHRDTAEVDSSSRVSAMLSHYGREELMDADFYGMHFMARAGYEPLAAVEVQQTFLALSNNREGSWFRELFSSHPPSMRRIKANQITARKLVPGNRYKNRFDAATKILRQDTAAYSLARRASRALSNNNPHKALELLDKAIAVQPGEEEFWRLQGDAWRALDALSAAERAYSTAIGRNKNFYLNHLSRGEIRYRQGKLTEGIKDIQRSHSFLPTYKASYHLGVAAFQIGDIEQAERYLQAASNDEGSIGSLARTELMNLRLKFRP